MAEQATTDSAEHTVIPLQPGLFEPDASGTLRLAASRCQRCTAHFFPRRLVCARCLSRDLLTVPLSMRGTLYTYTAVHQSTPEFPTPYLLAYVDLPEGVRLLAQLAGVPPDEVRIGMPLVVRIEPVRTDADGRPVLGWRLYPAAEVSNV